MDNELNLEAGELSQSSQAGELVGRTVGIGQAMYLPQMDVPLALSVNVDAAIADSSRKASDLDTQRYIGQANATKNYFDKIAARADVETSMIRAARKQVKTGTEAYKYSAQVSRLQDAKDVAEHEASQAGTNKVIRQHKRTVTEASKVQWKYKARQAFKKIQEYTKALGEDGEFESYGTNQAMKDVTDADVIDIEI